MKLTEAIESYITYRQALGEKFKTNAGVLRSFAKYVGEEAITEEVTQAICEAYLYGPEGTVSANWFCKHTALKGFFQWAVVRSIINDIPLPTELPRRPGHIRPYIYTDAEIRALFDNALTYQKNRSTTHPECVREILVLTYLLGLRIHETMNLKINDIDMEQRMLTVDDSKFYKTRLEPFNDSVKNELEVFLNWRRRAGMPEDENSFLFLDKKGKPMNEDSFHNIFRRVREKAGIVRRDGAIYQPRIHDLRHTFAVKRLTEWYKSGSDVQTLLPLLSTYMGHTHLAHTSVYLTMTDELLSLANSRFESYWKGGENEL